jgi:hypothetical protein
MKKHLLLILLIFSIAYTTQAQALTQTIRGKIIDRDTRQPLVGAALMLQSDTARVTGSVTNSDGFYRLQKVPVGRHTLRFTYVGYKDVVLNNIIVTSAKEVLLDVEMDEFVTNLKDVEVKATRSGEVSNEMATLSALAFTVDETERYAGSRGDPARMASNFAGVQGADDSRNDIVIRGNSPGGVLWRVDGINIPNPNHFAIAGTGGGPVSIINNKTLANSDFYTGAFPAEFGNSIAGVFDLRLRNGNAERHEFSGQFGFLGTELFAEGPLHKESRASYMVAYRYSTLQMFSALNINIGTSAVPRYQDATFKINLPQKKGGQLSFWGMGGLSNIDILISKQKTPEVNIYGENDRDQYFGSTMGTLGMTYMKPLSTTAFVKFSAAASTQTIDAHHDYIYRHVDKDGNFVVDSFLPILNYTFRENKYSTNLFVFKKLNARNTLNAGIINDLYGFNFVDSVRTPSQAEGQDFDPFRVRWNAREAAFLLQPYIQWKHRFSDRMELNAGLHSQYFTLNGSFSPLEPRLGLKYQLPNRQSVGMAMGVHSQLQPTYMYFYGTELQNGRPIPINRHMGFTKSNHFGLAYDKLLLQNMRFKAETYYQHLYNVPVDPNPEQGSFSLINTGVGFTRFFPERLQNTGTGQNYGLELTLEKFFSNHYFFMITGSLFESKYRGSDGVLRDTDFNGNYALNGLFTREFIVNRNSSISLGTKITAVGGRRYGPVDEEASLQALEVIYIDHLRNTQQLRDYFRTDFRINYKLNRKKVTHEIALDLINIFNTRNVLKLTYAPDSQNPARSSIREEYQLGFLPIFYYKIDF